MATTTFLEPGTDATQDFSLFASTATTGTGAITSATDQVETGTRAIKIAQGAGSGTGSANSPAGVLTDTGSQFSFYVYTDVLPTTSNAAFISTRQSGGNAVFSVGMNTDGTLLIVPVGATNASGTYVMSVNTWYRVCVSYYFTNTTTFQIKAYVHDRNGKLLDTVTANAGTITRITTSILRVGSTIGWANNSNIWIDNIYVATGGASSGSQPDTSEIRVTAKRPFANGTTNGFTTQIGSGGSGYGSGHAPQVNEQPLSQTNGWSMVGAGSAVTEEYAIEGASVGDVNITFATIVDYMGWVFAKSLVSETGQIVVGGSSSNISLTSTPTAFLKAAGSTTYPGGGTDIGIVTDTTLTTVSLYECGVIFAYVAPNTRLLAILGAGI